MKRYNLFGGAFITEDRKGNLKYYIKEEVRPKIDLTSINSNELRKEYEELKDERTYIGK